MDVAVISLNEEFSTSELKKLFPLALVYVQKGVNLKQVSDINLYKSGIIGASAFTTIHEGRKWHWELNSKGGVGLVQANRFALSKNSDPILMLEDDFNIYNEAKFLHEMSLLKKNEMDFDYAVFGALYQGDERNLTPVNFMPKGWYFLNDDKFWYTHCVFYSRRGRNKVADYLSNNRLEMQIDGLLSFLAEVEHSKCIIQISDISVGQTLHPSSIQTDAGWCYLCDLAPEHIPERIVYKETIAFIMVSLICAVAFVCMNKRKMFCS